ncbi:30S ribosomal protein S19 [Candidatus Peregrinibacteria bacterium]|nr:30S ribosomal protein S19 [Candidatus Peregrinibacteria bacterium]
MSRSLKKGIYVEPKLLKKVQAMEATGQKKVIRTWARASAIPPEFVGHTFGVHNGKTHVSVFVTEDMVGYKLGEFVPTRKFKAHGGTISKVEAAAPAPAPKK